MCQQGALGDGARRQGVEREPLRGGTRTSLSFAHQASEPRDEKREEKVTPMMLAGGVVRGRKGRGEGGSSSSSSFGLVLAPARRESSLSDPHHDAYKAISLLSHDRPSQSAKTPPSSWRRHRP